MGDGVTNSETWLPGAGFGVDDVAVTGAATGAAIVSAVGEGADLRPPVACSSSISSLYLVFTRIGSSLGFRLWCLWLWGQ